MTSDLSLDTFREGAGSKWGSTSRVRFVDMKCLGVSHVDRISNNGLHCFRQVCGLVCPISSMLGYQWGIDVCGVTQHHSLKHELHGMYIHFGLVVQHSFNFD